MASMLDKLRNVVTGGAQKTLSKAAGSYEACPTCGNVTAKREDPKKAAQSIDAQRKKMSKGNMGE